MDVDPTLTVGRPNFFVPQDVIATVFDLAEAAWTRVLTDGLVTRCSTEPALAGHLVTHMQVLKRERGLLLLIIEEVGTRSTGSPKPDGRIDIKIYDNRSFSEPDYFGLECKRVSRADRTLARKYVSEGVARFTRGKYSPGHDHAGMVGFAIDADCLGCSATVASVMVEASAEIQLIGAWGPAPAPVTRENLFHTRHLQQPSRIVITVLHLFLAVN